MLEWIYDLKNYVNPNHHFFAFKMLLHFTSNQLQVNLLMVLNSPLVAFWKTNTSIHLLSVAFL